MHLLRILCLFMAALVLILPMGRAQGVLVNEVHTGDPDYIEVLNSGSTPVDISGWTLRASFGYLIYPPYTFPTGSTIAAGELILAIEHSGGGIGPPLPPVPTAAQTFATGFGWGWVGTSSGSVVLSDAAGQTVDVVVFGTDTVTVPPPGSSQPFTNPLDRTGNDPGLDDAVYRNSTSDSNDGADWSLGSDPDSTPGTFNAGQSAAPIDVARLELDEASATFIVQGGQATLTATIDRIVATSGTEILSANVDPLVGGTVTMTGPFLAGNSADLSGTVIAPLSAIITSAGGTDTLDVDGILLAWGETWELGGTAEATPTPITTLASQQGNNVTRSTTGSQSLAGLFGALQSKSFAVHIRREGGQLTPLAVEIDYAPRTPDFAATAAENAPGQLEIGFVGSNGGEVWNFFDVAPTIPFGSGPLFGMELGPLQIAIAGLPVGTHPFHVLPDQNGNYHFITPPGAIPMGVVFDFLAIEVNAGVARHSAVTRITF